MNISGALKVAFLISGLIATSSCACVCTNESCGGPAKPLTARTKNADFSVGGTSDSGTAGALETIHFNYKQSAPNNGEMDRIQANIEWLKANPKVKLLLEGHGDRVGSSSYNVELSKSRTETVRQLLITGGIESSRLKTRPLGHSVPVANPSSKSKFETGVDRRVNFVIESID